MYVSKWKVDIFRTYKLEFYEQAKKHTNEIIWMSKINLFASPCQPFSAKTWRKNKMDRQKNPPSHIQKAK